ncbi:hypothetical protein S7711_05462 [Stachybotrys chartarum IBT 7711]|uniref:Uncharacterized protein n=1 Tax=Stachybotrys chartarum (strain CBS 109288 / IBT 7711) TaxID=1280523 RepID=A0A084BAY3_STACB|nr:hypothetical protein S7711_05462 [Stachybotrys chartarum IBT 7711]KFA80115.1 hypothetical protein S40288_04652 [Stachybotrys chartarum IBT 40288]
MESSMEFPLATTLIITAAATLVYLGYLSALPKPIPGIPYDESAAKHVFGSLPGMISHIKEHGVVMPWLTQHNSKHQAPLVQFFGGPFAKPTLVLCDFQESQDVLLRRTKDFDRAGRTLEAMAGVIPNHHIAMRSDDGRFKGNKELVRDLMSPSFLHEVSAVQIYSKSLALIDLWSVKAKATSGRPFEARQDIFDAAMDMVNAAAFAFEDDLSITKQNLNYIISAEKPPTIVNADLGALDFSRPPLVSEVAVLQAVAKFLGEQTVSPAPKYIRWYKMITDAKLRRNLVSKDEVIKSRIQKSLKRLEAGDKTQFSATDYLIQREYSVARKENRSPDFYSRRNIDELFGYIIGGHETTSAAISWTIKLLSDHPRVQEELRESLRTSFAAAVSESRLPTATEIAKSQIPYLDAVIEESLRVGRPTPMVARESMVDTVLLGHRIPKGVTLLLSNAGPGFISKPLQIPDSMRSESSKTKQRVGEWDLEGMHLFKPERWLKEEDGVQTFDSQAGPFLAFSLGHRGCFGRRLAYLEMRLVLTLLLWNFRFDKLEGKLASYDTEEGVTAMPKFCYVRLQAV